MKVYRVFSFFLILAMLFSIGSIRTSVVTASTAPEKTDLNGLTPGLEVNSMAPQTALPLVKKIPDAATVNANDPIGFLLQVTNTTANPMTNVVFRDQLDRNVGWTVNDTACSIDGAGLLTCQFALLPAGWTYQVHISAISTPAMCGTLTNTLQVASDQTPPITDTASILIRCQADVTITKTEENPSIISGDVVRYTLEVRSIGTGAAEGVVVNDALPNTAGLAWSVESVEGGTCQITGFDLTCSLGVMAPGEARRVVISSPTTAAECGDIINSATVSASNEDAVKQGNNSESGTVTVYCTTLMVEKLPDAELVNANDPIGFSLRVTNSGGVVARNVTLTDQLPAGVDWTEDSPSCAISGGVLSCSFGDLAAGASASLHVGGRSSAAVCGTMTNTAVAQATNIVTQSQDTAVVEIHCAPKLSISKLPEQSSVAAGLPVRFTITVNNIGTAPARNVTITDHLPSSTSLTWAFDNVSAGGSCEITEGVLNCNFGTLNAGQSASVRISASSTMQTCGFLVNTVTAKSDDTNIVSDVSQVDIICTPNVSITKSAEREEVIAGNDAQPARFIITVTSNGNTTANGVTLSDPLPTQRNLSWRIDSVVGGGTCSISGGNLTCNFGNLASGQTRTVTVSSNVGLGEFCNPANEDRTIMNTATVSAQNEPQDALMDNSAYASIYVLCAGAVCESPDEVYSNDFNGAVPGAQYWSSYPLSTSPNGSQTFLGELDNNEIRFTYPDTDPFGHHMIKVSFDLYILRSWDGNLRDYQIWTVGPDIWRFSVLNAAGAVSKTITNTTFTNFYDRPVFNQAYPESYPDSSRPALTGADAINTMGYQWYGPRDSVYHLTYYIPHNDPIVNLSFSALGLQDLQDESWGIDNFELRLIRCNTEYTLENYIFLPTMNDGMGWPYWTIRAANKP